MLVTSNEYKMAIRKNRKLYHKARIILASGEEVLVENRQLINFAIEDAVSSDSTFDIGAAVINSLDLTVDNTGGIYTSKDFNRATVYPSIGLQIQDKIEWLNKGIYTVSGSPIASATLRLECLDHMHKFERKYDSKLVYPATLGEIVSDACLECGVPVGTIPRSDYMVANYPGSDCTYLDVISACAKLMGRWARMDNSGVLEFGWYQDDTGDGVLSGGDFAYEALDTVSGGDFAYGALDILSAGGFWYANGTYVYDLSSINVAPVQLTISGVSVDIDGIEYKSGVDGYVLRIKSGLFIDANNAQEVVDYIAAQVVGQSFCKMTVSGVSDPSIEAGDIIVITDRQQNIYKSVITRLSYKARANETFVTSCESAMDNEARKYTQSSLTEQIVGNKTNGLIHEAISKYDDTAQNMTSLISQGFGLYSTTIPDGNGAVKQYLHDAPIIDESSVVWTRTAQGLLVSKDGATTWAIDANGNALFNLLMVHGLSADWVHIGGQGNGDGTLAVKDKDGNVIVLINNAGITMKDGTSIINASGVCGDLTFTSGGVPYDIGWGYDYANDQQIKQEVQIQAYIPDNYIVTSAYLILSMCATDWVSVWDADGDRTIYDTCLGYPRKVKAFIGQGAMYKYAWWDGSYGYRTNGNFNQIVSGGFASGGVDGSTTVNEKKIISNNIGNLIKNGLNIIKFSPEDFVGTTNLSYAQRTGTATAMLSVKGYTKN